MSMIINLNELNYKKRVDINYKVNKDEELDKRIIDLKDAYVIGSVINTVDSIILECEFSGTMIINDSITLEEIPYAFTIKIKENLDDLIENYVDCYENLQN